MSDSLDLSKPLAPPEGVAVPGAEASPGTALELSPPQAVPVLADEQVDSMVPLDEATRVELQKKAAAFAAELAAQDPHSPAFQDKVNDITKMGEREIIASARVSNRMLERPAAALASARGGKGSDAQSRVAGSLLELRQTVTELDPAKADLKGVKKILGMIPVGNKLKRYFERYQSAQKQLDAIIKALDSGQDELRKDNAAIEQEKANLWAAMGKLTEYATLAKALDGAVQTQIDALKVTDPRAGQRRHLRRALPDPPAPAGPADPAGRQRAGLPRARPGAQEQHRAHQGRRPGADHHGRRASHRRHRGAGAGQPEAGARPDQRPERDDQPDDPVDQRDASPAVGADPGAGGLEHGQRRDAAEGVRQRLRDHGRDRHLQGEGRRQHGHDRDGARDRRSPVRSPTWSAPARRRGR